MANPEHVAILKQGVEAWNTWRAENPDVQPDLSGTVDEPFDFNVVFKDTAIWRPWNYYGRPPGAVGDEGVVLRHVPGDRTSSVPVNFSRTDLGRAIIAGADLSRVNFQDADISRSDLSGSDLWRCDLSRAKLYKTCFANATLHRNNLTKAHMFRSDVSNADLSQARWRPSQTFRKAPDKGLDSMRNNPVLQRYWLDELHIDALRSSTLGKPQSMQTFLMDERGPLRRPWWLVFAVLGALLAGVIAIAHTPFLGLGTQWPWLLAGAFFGGALGVFLSSYWGARLGFWVWGLFDYGRSWGAVLFTAVLLIAAFGFAYAAANGTHVLLASPSNPGADHWFYPWFVAAMGFSTLGVTDVAKPLTGLGQLIMMANVLAGFATFGLLLSVLGNTFARRS